MFNYSSKMKERAEDSDWYATPEEILCELKHMVEKYTTDDDVLIDAGAADGRIMNALKHVKHKSMIGLDVNPRRDDILCKNFLDWRPTKDDGESFVLTCNPPFRIPEARNAPKKFIEHALTFCRLAICIIPLNFRKSVYKHQLAEVNITQIDEKVMPKQWFHTKSG